MSKKMCDMKKKVKDDLASIAEMVQPARFICRKCARVANIEHLLCKPVLLPEAPRQEEQNAR